LLRRLESLPPPRDEPQSSYRQLSANTEGAVRRGNELAWWERDALGIPSAESYDEWRKSEGVLMPSMAAPDTDALTRSSLRRAQTIVTLRVRHPPTLCRSELSLLVRGRVRDRLAPPQRGSQSDSRPHQSMMATYPRRVGCVSSHKQLRSLADRSEPIDPEQRQLHLG
jgi:hypothetical protein